MPLQHLLVVKLSNLHVVYSYSPAPLDSDPEFHLWQTELASLLRKSTFDNNFSTFYCGSVLVCAKKVGSLLFLLTGDPLDNEFARECSMRSILLLNKTYSFVSVSSVRYTS